MNYLEQAIEKISSQQPKERTPVWMVGEQLKDILRAEPRHAELILRDLDIEKLSLANCEKEIKKFADKHKNSGFSCVIPSEADAIIRKFYGIPEPGTAPTAPKPIDDGKIIDLSSFFGL